MKRRQAHKLCALVALLFAAGLAGCAKSVFPQNDTRSQYTRFDQVRGQDTPPYIMNEFGRLVPNLRGRLLKDQ